jgi:hypothetical protein
MKIKKTIFFLAHYDDEFGIFEDIRLHVSEKIPFHIVYLTNSNLDKSNNKIRQKESLSVLKILGVKTSQISFIGKELLIPDLQLKNYLISAYLRCKSLIKKLGNIGKIYTHAYEGGHPDHDALNFLCSKLISESKTKIDGWQFPLYSGSGLVGPFFFLFKPLKRNGKIKKIKINIIQIKLYLMLIFFYKSQFKTFLGLYPFFFFHMIFKKNYLVQKINIKKKYFRPHKGKLLYERRNMDQFEELKLKMNEFEIWLKKSIK